MSRAVSSVGYTRIEHSEGPNGGSEAQAATSPARGMITEGRDAQQPASRLLKKGC